MAAKNLTEADFVRFLGFVDVMESSDTEAGRMMSVAKTISDIYIWVLFAIGVPANLVTIVTIITLQVVCPTTLLIALLAALDCISLVTKLTGHQLVRGHVYIGDIGCKFEFTSVVWPTLANWALVFVCADRFLTVCHPTRKSVLVTLKNCLIGVASFSVFVFLVYGGISVPVRGATLGGYRCGTYSQFSWFWVNIWYWINAALYLFIPALLIMPMTILMVRTLHIQNKQRKVINETGAVKVIDETGAVKVIKETGAVKVIDETIAVKVIDVTGAAKVIDETGAVKVIDETDAVKVIDETGAVKVIDETGVVKVIDETGAVKVIDETGAVKVIDETGAVKVIDETGTVKVIDETGAVKVIDETGDVKVIDETGAVKVIDETGAVEEICVQQGQTFRSGNVEEENDGAFTMMIIMALLMFLVLCLPSCVFYLAYRHSNSALATAQWALFEQVQFVLADSTHVINFFLYFLSAKAFRSQFVTLTTCRKSGQSVLVGD